MGCDMVLHTQTTSKRHFEAIADACKSNECSIECEQTSDMGGVVIDEEGDCNDDVDDYDGDDDDSLGFGLTQLAPSDKTFKCISDISSAGSGEGSDSDSLPPDYEDTYKDHGSPFRTCGNCGIKRPTINRGMQTLPVANNGEKKKKGDDIGVQTSPVIVLGVEEKKSIDQTHAITGDIQGGGYSTLSIASQMVDAELPAIQRLGRDRPTCVTDTHPSPHKKMTVLGPVYINPPIEVKTEVITSPSIEVKTAVITNPPQSEMVVPDTTDNRCWSPDLDANQADMIDTVRVHYNNNNNNNNKCSTVYTIVLDTQL